MRIIVVIVTYNRLIKLKHALECFSNQTKLPYMVIVVNNASTDGTKEYLSEWESNKKDFLKKVVNLEHNLGGSGGYYYGLLEAIKYNGDWVWVSDDDAFPDVNAIKYSSEYINESRADNIAAICGKVITNGDISKEHRRIVTIKGLRIQEVVCGLKEYEKESFDINAFSYVGSIIKKQSLIEVGVTEKDYFICVDDTEHSLRISKCGRIVCIPRIVINHDVDETNNGLSWKDFYLYRNQLDMYKKHMPSKCYKRTVLVRTLRSIYLMLFAKNKEYARLYRVALHDGRKGKLGMHPLYKPGWKPQKIDKK